MAYSRFTLNDIKRLGYTRDENQNLFSTIPPVAISNILESSLIELVPMALIVNTERSRSEWIISPILVELKRVMKDKISLFPGKPFNIDAKKGLMGACDYLISRSESQLQIEAPVVAIVEAKKEDIPAFIAQCGGEMIAAQIFNERMGVDIKAIYGSVTTGDRWKFLKLENKTLSIDIADYYLKLDDKKASVEKILGILVYMVS